MQFTSPFGAAAAWLQIGKAGTVKFFAPIADPRGGKAGQDEARHFLQLRSAKPGALSLQSWGCLWQSLDLYGLGLTAAKRLTAELCFSDLVQHKSQICR